MREILFRGKRLDTGEWVEGFIVASRENTYPDGFEMITIDGINYDELDDYQPAFMSYSVDPDTVGQYTGLRDKNGKRIFEGDIVQDDKLEYRLLNDPAKGEKRRGIAVVRFGQHEVPSDDPFCWGNAYGFYLDGDTLRPTPAQYKPYDEDADGTLEVIGNIHDHPSLLQG